MTLTAGYSYNDTKIEANNLLVATCGSEMCTTLDLLIADDNVFVDDNPFPLAPMTIFSVSGL